MGRLVKKRVFILVIFCQKILNREIYSDAVRPRVKNPKSHNGTETNQLTIYKRGRGFTRVIQTLIR